jgi:hypothetical protein
MRRTASAGRSWASTITGTSGALAFPGNYPRALDGLARLLSLDMRVVDPAWIGMKLRKLLNYAEPLGHFMAFVPGLPGASAASRSGPRRWRTSRAC